MKTIKKNCLNCNKEIMVEERYVKRGHGKFCNLRCSTQYNSKERARQNAKKPNVNCAMCNKEFYKTISKMKLSKSGLYFCCRAHKDQAQRIGGIKEIMPPQYGKGKPDVCDHYRRIAFSKKSMICERCSYDKDPAAIVIHHKDRNRMNDAEENLEVLCSNCHAIEHWGKKHSAN